MTILLNEKESAQLRSLLKPGTDINIIVNSQLVEDTINFLQDFDKMNWNNRLNPQDVPVNYRPS